MSEEGADPLAPRDQRRGGQSADIAPVVTVVPQFGVDEIRKARRCWRYATSGTKDCLQMAQCRQGIHLAALLSARAVATAEMLIKEPANQTFSDLDVLGIRRGPSNEMFNGALVGCVAVDA